jgi:glycine cleavage system H protein
MTDVQVEVSGYAIRLDRGYDPETHLWVLQMPDGRYRVGLDALTADTYGALAQLAFEPVGTDLAGGAAFGSLEAAKFVGPLLSPVAGRLVAVNEAVLADPELVLRDPYEGGWLIEVDGTAEPTRLLHQDAALAWFDQAVAEHREQGLVAE